MGSALKHGRPSWLGRRAFLLGALALSEASALDRIPYGGAISLKLPWPVERLDPHAIDDALSALFAPAVYDPLFALDSQKRPYPTLVDGLPERAGRSVRVTLREGLVTAQGNKLEARDVLFSLGRARKLGAMALLAGIVEPRAQGTRAILFDDVEPDTLARLLANPLTALVPRRFSPLGPDGTGAFSATLGGGRLTLRRNLHAARGPGFLESLVISQARDLADALRAFEAGDTEIGWLGRGLHLQRRKAVSFDAGPFGYCVLRTGRAVGAWGAPGVAQRLLDSIDTAQLKHLGLSAPAGPARKPLKWGGPNTELLVADSAPHLIEIARELAVLLAKNRGDLSVRHVPAREAQTRASSGDFGLMLDFVRIAGPPQITLLAAADPELARRPPRHSPRTAREVAATLRLGVVGELHAAGAHSPKLHGLAGFDLGDVWEREP